MRRTMAALCSILVAVCLFAKLSRADEAKKADDKAQVVASEKSEKPVATEAAAKDAKDVPETIKFEQTAKMAPVTFPHKKHIEKLGGCKDCHEGEKPLFKKEKSKEGLKMKDMYTGSACGKCHDGKKAYAAKTGCMKCHKKIVEEKAAKPVKS